MDAQNTGKITQVIGAVLDIKFGQGMLPDINDPGGSQMLAHDHAEDRRDRWIFGGLVDQVDGAVIAGSRHEKTPAAPLGMDAQKELLGRWLVYFFDLAQQELFS